MPAFLSTRYSLYSLTRLSFSAAVRLWYSGRLCFTKAGRILVSRTKQVKSNEMTKHEQWTYCSPHLHLKHGQRGPDSAQCESFGYPSSSKKHSKDWLSCVVKGVEQSQYAARCEHGGHFSGDSKQVSGLAHQLYAMRRSKRSESVQISCGGCPPAWPVPPWKG